MFLKEEFKVIKEKDPAIKSGAEVFLYSSFWAMISHRIAHALYKKKLYFLARFISQWSRLFTGIEIHPGAVIGKSFFIDHGMGVVIGETTEIGDNVLIYQGVTLGGTGKDTGKRHPTIEDNVMIGSGVKVLGPIIVGKNSKIGAGSVVLRNVPENSTVVGVPAKCTSCEVSFDAPSDTLDQLNYADPVEIKFNELTNKINQLENKLKRIGEDKNNADI